MTVTDPPRPRRQAPGVVSPADARRTAKAVAQRSDRRRAWRRRVLRTLSVLLPLAALAWVVLASPLLAVDRVQVTGVERLTPEQVVEVAGVPLGTPLARVDTGRTGAQVASLAPARQVRVRRVWPTTLRIDVVERVAVAAVTGGRDAGDGALLLDSGGVDFATEPTVPAGLPQLEVASPGRDDPATRAALEVLLALPDDLRARVEVVRAATPVDVSLGLVDGRTVAWGAPGDTATKVAAVTALLRMPGEFYDVSAPGVAVRR